MHSSGFLRIKAHAACKEQLLGEETQHFPAKCGVAYIIGAYRFIVDSNGECMERRENQPRELIPRVVCTFTASLNRDSTQPSHHDQSVKAVYRRPQRSAREIQSAVVQASSGRRVQKSTVGGRSPPPQGKQSVSHTVREKDAISPVLFTTRSSRRRFANSKAWTSNTEWLV